MALPHSSTADQGTVSYDAPVSDDAVPGVAVTLEDTDDDFEKIKLGGLRMRKRTCWIVIIGICVLIAAIAGGVVFLMLGDEPEDGSGITDKVVQSDAYYKERYNNFRPVIGRLSNPSALLQPDTPQSQALQWLVYEDETLSHTAIDEEQLAQRYAVFVLFYACGGEQWQGFTDTLDKQRSVDTCSLGEGEIFACGGDQVVNSLDLEGRRLTGELPDEIALLTGMQTLNLHNNFVKGTIPTTISDKLSNLEHLILSRNELANTIPSELGLLTGLETLDLGINKLTGTIPLELQQLTNLKQLDLKENLISGPFFEPFLAAMPKMKSVHLDRTLLTGTIPATVIRSLSNLKSFRILQTLFSGTLPSEISLLSDLRELIVFGDNLGGRFPDLTLLTNMRQIVFEGDLHTGTIPTTVGLLTNMIDIRLIDTGHTGTIPTEIGLVTNMELLTIMETAISGTIPSEIGKLTNMMTLTIKDNEEIVGNMPETICPRQEIMTVRYSCFTGCDCCIEQCCN